MSTTAVAAASSMGSRRAAAMAAAGTTTKLTMSSATTNRMSRSGWVIRVTVRPRPMADMLPTTNTSMATLVMTSSVSESMSIPFWAGRAPIPASGSGLCPRGSVDVSDPQAR